MNEPKAEKDARTLGLAAIHWPSVGFAGGFFFLLAVQHRFLSLCFHRSSIEYV